jgi:FHA domain-containing protein
VYEISVVSYQGNPPEEPIRAVFGRDGGTIGRAPGNNLVLSDPNRFVSRVQAKVACDGAKMTITNASTANPLLVNDREVDAGATATICDGDELRVGLFLLRVRRVASQESDDAQESPSCVIPQPIPPSSDVSASRSALSDTSFSRVAGGLDPVDPLQLQPGDTGADPFGDLIPDRSGGVPPAQAASGSNRSSSMPDRTPIASGDSIPAQRNSSPRPAIEPAKIPDSVWDDLAQFSPRDSDRSSEPPVALPANFDAFAEPSSAPRNADDPLAEFAQSGIALDSLDKLDMPVDKLFSDIAPGVSLSDPVVPDPHAAAPDPLADPDTVDPLAMFGDDASDLRIAANPGFTRSEADDVPELGAFFRPPAPHFEQPERAPGADQVLVENLTQIVLRPPAASASTTAPTARSVAVAATEPPDIIQRSTVRGGRASGEQRIPQDVPLADAPFQGSVNGEFDDRLLQELLAGAGIPNATIKGGLTPELMKRIGAMLAAAIQGTIELIATRALLKREVKADVTIIASTHNNPLKFLPDSESALLHMFGSRIPGFMAPVEAMEDAFKDLRAHEVGVVAGMHAALAQVLARFEPSALGKRLKPAGVLESLLPNSHKARLWEEFEEMYVDISREAQDDFQSLFGKAFLQAYESEISRLKEK